MMKCSIFRVRQIALATFLGVLFSATGHAEEKSAREIVVLAAEGKVTFRGSTVEAGDKFNKNGVVKTGPGSSAKLFLPKARTITILKEKSAVRLAPTAKKRKVNRFGLIKGLSRWIVNKVEKNEPVVVTSKSAIMGVRGTDVLLSYNPLLKETEIITFAGKAFFRPMGTKKPTPVNQGQWGGVGGRFGSSVGEILDLPARVLKHFKTKSSQKTTLEGAENPAYHGQKVPE